MNKRKLLLLKYFLNNCDNGYKVLEISKILLGNKRYKGDISSLSEDIEYLKTYKYIDVKYMDNKNICLSILDNTRIFQENIKIEKVSHRSQLSGIFINMICSGIMAFLGAFLAIILLR